jgi:hypothetical protein
MTRRYDDISKPLPARPFIWPILSCIICLSVMLGAATLMVR